MFKVVIFKDFLKTGRGADRATARLADVLAQRGDDVHIVTKHSAKHPFSVTLDERVTCHALPERKRPLARLLNKLLLTSAAGEWVLRHCLPFADTVLCYSKRFQRLLQTLSPDILIITGSNECVDALYAGRLSLPVVMMFHVFPPECFRKNKYRRVSRLRRTLPNVAACQVLLPSHCAALRAFINVPCTAIGNGLTWQADTPLPKVSEREKTIVYIAYFSSDKNHTDLLHAFALLNAPEWTLQLYGSGTPEWETRLKTLANELGIADRVRFMGVTDDTQQSLLNAGICAYPSKVEGFGLALVEAMWCGLPCVGFANAPGVNELLVHEANGLLADPTPQAFAAQLQRLIDDAALRERLGEVAARTVRQTYRQEVITQQWCDLFDALLAPRKNTQDRAEDDADPVAGPKK